MVTDCHTSDNSYIECFYTIAAPGGCAPLQKSHPKIVCFAQEIMCPRQESPYFAF